MWKHELLYADTWKGQKTRWVQAKRDGNRLTVFRQPQWHIRALTTTGLDLAPVLRDWPWWACIVQMLPPCSSLDGELWVPGRPASYVKTALKERDPKLKFSVFAVPYYDQICQTQQSLVWAHDICLNIGLPFIEFFDETPEVLGPDDEGWVFKDYNYERWWKWKPVRTLDAIVVGFKEGNGKFLGTVGALIVAVETMHGDLVEIASVGGMTDAVRWEIDEDADLGRIVEVKYQYVGAKGRLRHPRFVRWRDDKAPGRCTTKQDPQLEEYYG